MSAAKTPAKRKTKKRSELAEKLNRLLRKQSLVEPGEHLGVAVSGGADSVAMLRALLELRETLGFIVIVVHFNHQLRGRNSDADEKFVHRLAKQHGVEFVAGREDIAARANRERGNVEEVARRARYAFFEKLKTEGHVDKVAVAHTADDQAETVLAHILRGTGLSGLRGIHPQTGIAFRPMLGVRRHELRAFLKSIKQSWREDATNRDTKRMRARIRKKLLPVLETEFNAGVVEHLCQLAELAGEDEDFWASHAARWIARSTQQKEREIVARVADLLQAPSALRTRVLRRIVSQVKTRGGQLSKEHVAAVLELITQQASGKEVQLPGGVEVRRESELLRFRNKGASARSNEKKESTEYAHELNFRGGQAELRLVELSCVLHFREIDWLAEGGETSERGAVLDRSRLRTPLTVRNWRPGDAMRPRGHQKAHRLARLLNEKSVSRWEKQKWPVLTSGGKLAWVRGLAESVDFAVGPDTQRAVLISEEPLL